MIVALDVYYEDEARVGALAFDAWDSANATREWVTEVTEIAPYEPGEFFRRELPCLLAGLNDANEALNHSMTAVIIDGYVWLDDSGRPGLGAHLYEALDESVAVIGVAKNPFAGNTAAVEVLRGESVRPLYVTSAGMAIADAADAVRAMHGDYRMPTLLQRVDALSRG